jgi:hypothetical protein
LVADLRRRHGGSAAAIMPQCTGRAVEGLRGIPAQTPIILLIQ